LKFIQEQQNNQNNNLIALWKYHNDRFYWAVLESIANLGDLEKIREEAAGVILCIMAIVNEREGILNKPAPDTPDQIAKQAQAESPEANPGHSSPDEGDDKGVGVKAPGNAYYAENSKNHK